MAEAPLLSYADIIGMNYIPATAGIVLSAAEQTLALQAVSIFGFSEMWSDYDTNADDIEALVAATQYALLNTTIPPVENMNTNIILYPDRASVLSGNTPLWTSQTGSSLGGVWLPTPAATADAMRWDFFLSAGKYNIDMIYQRATNNGKGDLKIYNAALTLITTIAVDMRGAAQFNTVSGGSFDNPTGGRIRVEWVGTGASSGSVYNRPLQRIIIDKYAEL